MKIESNNNFIENFGDTKPGDTKVDAGKKAGKVGVSGGNQVTSSKVEKNPEADPKVKPGHILPTPEEGSLAGMQGVAEWLDDFESKFEELKKKSQADTITEKDGKQVGEDSDKTEELPEKKVDLTRYLQEQERKAIADGLKRIAENKILLPSVSDSLGISAGSLSSLLAALVELIANEFTENIIEHIKSQQAAHKVETQRNIEKLNESIEKAKEAKKAGILGQIFSIISAVVAVIAAVAMTVGSLGAATGPAALLIAGAVIAIIGAAVSLLNAIPADGKMGGMGLFSAALKEIALALGASKEMAEKIGTWLSVAIEIALAVVATILSAGAASGGLVNAIKGAAKSIKDLARGLFTTIGNTFKAVSQTTLKSIGRALVEMFKRIFKAIQKLLQNVKELAQETYATIKNMLKAIKGVISAAGKPTVEGLKNALNRFVDTLIDVLSSMKDFFKGVGQYFSDIVKIAKGKSAIKDLTKQLDTITDATKRAEILKKIEEIEKTLVGPLANAQNGASLLKDTENILRFFQGTSETASSGAYMQSGIKSAEALDAQAGASKSEAAAELISFDIDRLRDLLSSFLQQRQQLMESLSDMQRSSLAALATVNQNTRAKA